MVKDCLVASVPGLDHLTNYYTQGSAMVAIFRKRVPRCGCRASMIKVLFNICQNSSPAREADATTTHVACNSKATDATM